MGEVLRSIVLGDKADPFMDGISDQNHPQIPALGSRRVCRVGSVQERERERREKGGKVVV